MSEDPEAKIDELVKSEVERGAWGTVVLVCLFLVLAIFAKSELNIPGYDRWANWPFYAAFVLFFTISIFSHIILAFEAVPNFRPLLSIWSVNWRLLNSRTVRQARRFSSSTIFPYGLGLFTIWMVTLSPFPVVQVLYMLLLYFGAIFTFVPIMDKSGFPKPESTAWLVLPILALIFFLPLFGAERLAATTDRGVFGYVIASAAIFVSVFIYFELLSLLALRVAGLASGLLIRVSGSASRLLHSNERKTRFVGIAQYLFYRHLTFQMLFILTFSPLFFVGAEVVDPRWIVVMYTGAVFGFPFFTIALMARGEPRSVYNDLIRHTMPFAGLFIVSLNTSLYITGIAAHWFVDVLDWTGLTTGFAIFPDFIVAFARSGTRSIPVWTMAEATVLAVAFSTSIAWVFGLVIRHEFVRLARGLLVIAATMLLPLVVTEEFVSDHIVHDDWLTPRIFLVTAIPAVVGGALSLLADKLGKPTTCISCNETDHHHHAIFCHHCGSPLPDLKHSDASKKVHPAQLDFWKTDN